MDESGMRKETKLEGRRVLKSFDWAALVPVALVPVVLVVPAVLLMPLASTSPLAAQLDTIPGVDLGLLYEAETQPALAVQPFLGRLGGEMLASRVEAIIARDLRYSDRFEVMDSLPASLIADEIDYQLWDQLGASGLWRTAPSWPRRGSTFGSGRLTISWCRGRRFRCARSCGMRVGQASGCRA